MRPFSRENPLDDVAVDVGQPVIAACVSIGESVVMDAEEVKDGCVHVVHVDRIFSREGAEVIGGAVSGSWA